MRRGFVVVVLFVFPWLAVGLPPAPDGSRSPAQSGSGIPGIVFVGTPMFDAERDAGEGVYQGSYHWRDSYVYARSATYHRGERTMGPVRPGRNLFALIPASPQGELKQLTFLKTGAVFKPEPSFDGKRVLFSMRRDGEDWFHLCEINVDGTGFRQLTDGPFNDFAGVYLPDGRIVFVSDRTGYLEEYHEERTECLFVMNGDGTGIHQITFMPGTYFEPSIMKDGRILFSFWDAFHIDVPPLDKHETVLMTVNPDGTEERHLFGVGQHQYFGRERHSGVGLTQAHEMPDGRILCQSEMGPSLLDPRFGTHPRDALWPIFPGTTSIQLGGTTHRSHLSPLGTRSTPRPLADGRVLYSATAPGARDSGIYVCDPDTREDRLVFNIPDYAEYDAVPVLLNREKPRRIPSLLKDPCAYASGDPRAANAQFIVVAGRETDNPERAAALKRARYLRVIEAEYSAVTTSSHTNLETRILGVVPIHADGSAYFEAPADTPLFLDALDAAGNRILQDWRFESTSVPVGSMYPVTQMAYMVGRAGETKSCYGCHAPQNNAVPNSPLAAMKHPPVKITRESTDVQYRRNDPEAYRCQARVGEAGKYRPWLKSEDPILQARACELLMAIEDGVEEDVPTMLGLLREDMGPAGAEIERRPVEVRQAAALALTRLATHEHLEPLKKIAANSNDWLVRHHAGMALECLVLTGKLPDDCEAIGRLGARATARQREAIRGLLRSDRPPVSAMRAAGKLRDAESVALLAPWLKRHDLEFHAAEAAVALGRIGTREAVEALWAAVRSEVPIKQVVYARYLQHGPRPEEYALLKGLLLANAVPTQADIPFLIALLPNTFMEKPRFEDRLREESQRVLMPRLLLENAGLRRPIVDLLLGKAPDPALEALVLKGVNLERPFSEHGRPFPVVKSLGAEEALWLLGCLAMKGEVPEEFAVPHLVSKNHRERIDAAVVLGLQGFGNRASEALRGEIARPYDFPEIWSIGKGMPDTNFRDKAYMAQALAMHVADVHSLKPFANPKDVSRDIRYGLVRGLARRGRVDAVPLLLEMATADPLTLIRQQARHAVADIHDACRQRGESPPPVEWPEPKPLEALYPPRQLEWTSTEPDPLPRSQHAGGDVQRSLAAEVKDLLTPSHFRNLNMGQARGAERMMIAKVDRTGKVFEELAASREEDSYKVLKDSLAAPYPYAQYLAAKGLAAAARKDSIPILIAKVDESVKSQNAVGFWWSCETLGKLQARDAIPTLMKHAVPTNPPGAFGPEGLPTGYAAARAIGRIIADPSSQELVRLLDSPNPCIRAGALRGLAEARAPGIEPLLRRAASSDNPALLRAEAAVQLRRLR